MLREINSGRLRLSKEELRLLRKLAARNGHAPGPVPGTVQEVLILLIEGLPDEAVLKLVDELEHREAEAPSIPSSPLS